MLTFLRAFWYVCLLVFLTPLAADESCANFKAALVIWVWISNSNSRAFNTSSSYNV